MKDKNYYIYLFIIFLVLGIIILLGPIMLYCPVAYKILQILLFKLGNYKEAYLGMLGATIGTGLAVSSALWLQKNDALKKVNEENAAKKQKQKQAARILYDWVNREIDMLWGMWIWSTFDMSVYVSDDYELNFEPYLVNNINVFENYLIVGNELSEESETVILELYYLTERVNQYIQNYNSLNYDIVKTTSDTYGGSNSFSLSSRVSKNSTSIRYKNILKFIINQNCDFLFFDEGIDVMTINDYFRERGILEEKRKHAIDEMEKKYMSEQNENEHRAYSFVNRLVKKEIEAPDNYKDNVDSFDRITESLENLESTLDITIKDFFSNLESPLVSTLIKTLMNELQKLQFE